MAGIKEFNLQLDPSVDEVFDEGTGNSYLALRKLRWTDNSDYKLDIRKWFVNSDGDNIPGKGVSFITEKGPGNLINALIRHDYGDTKLIVSELKHRDDFLDATVYALHDLNINKLDIDESYKQLIEKEKENEEVFFDPKELFGC